ncbi:MAG TPA: hypothetical protein PLH56_05425 [Candidatus Omnitrophota bacterium]|nr:hypothetical protein [Candidatus Omnitrophota bacterium]HPN88758.1 hypothetical protein [Candidatus Omnitrophota bacterium]
MSYLYRGLRQEEVDNGQLIAKEQGVFAQHPKLPICLPFSLEKNIINAVINHQKNNGLNEYNTSGVSTSTEIEIAKKYATEYYRRDGYVAYISRDKLRKYNIFEFDVKADCPEVANPEDHEVILYDNVGGAMPKEVIEKIEKIQV